MSKKNRITRIRGFDSRSPLGNGLLSVGITRLCGFDSRAIWFPVHSVSVLPADAGLILLSLFDAKTQFLHRIEN